MELKEAVEKLFELIYVTLILRILLSWFPNIDWYKQPFKLLYDVSEPILGPFRRLIPPMGGIDFSPIIVFLVLQFIFGIILNIL